MGDNYGPFDSEARPVRQAFMAKKRQDGLTQQMLADDLGVTQGVVGRWINGHKRIPDEKLLRLSIILGFDPLDARPRVKDYVNFANKVLSAENREALIKNLEPLTESEEAQLLAYRDFLVSQRKKSG